MSGTGWHEVTFPEEIGNDSAGGPTWKTEVTPLDNGNEHRIQRWQDPKFNYDVVWGVKTWDDLRTLHDFFMQRRGKAYGFRFCDLLDHETGWQVLSPIEGETRVFQMVKTYGTVGSEESYTRPITLPRQPLLLRTQAGETVVDRDEGTDYVVDYASGVITITFDPTGLDIQGSCDFDVAVRFGVDAISIRLSDYVCGNTSVPLEGLRR